MTKRLLFDNLEHERPAKRSKRLRTDYLSQLSDELLLRILSFVSVSELCLTQRLSQRFNAVASDAQLWKALYYNRFVRPRAARLPRLRDAETAPGHLYFSSKLSKWLDEENLVSKGKETDWKRQYKLRHNWSRGSCALSEIQVAEQPSVPPLLAKFHDGVVYTADSQGGLQAWRTKRQRRLIANIHFAPANRQGNLAPTSLAVDTQRAVSGAQRVLVGFSDGSFTVFELRQDEGSFETLYRHPPSTNGTLSAVAYCSPYLLTMTASQLLSVYKFSTEPDDKRAQDVLNPPRLLCSLMSHTVWPPLALSIRPSSQNITASIAYAIPRYPRGWSVGIQEMRLTLEGDLIESRLASSADDAFRPLARPSPASSSPSTRSSSPASPSGSHDIYSKPTSLSYTHPYLLVSHPDNTLTLYLVTSTSSTLSISSGSRLWGHTSSVSSAHVGGRGKAVSVSSRGDELRVWELEGGMNSSANRRRLISGELSVQVRPEKKGVSGDKDLDSLSDAISQRGSGLGLALEAKLDDMSITKGWVGFDDENVVVLRERNRGSQTLVVYDFT
ncbi:hypothetical protein H2201_003735 [Coniosporium apollinis]|uniref:F-box domain-containing protein n=2 Tax=Coniosporium TaxID=2810619 RepID=A0ABQ9NVB2_9PEZI|nr:hypothetical protein H2199_005088 [Cladosporium sp. JES 115]KAJ9666057.1 hypothetical protein H2201_003735 [Coniosporium apollinis]